MNGLFNLGDFPLHSGGRSVFKIDCDALTDDDLAALAQIAVGLVGPFHQVASVPRGGDRFAEALRPYAIERAAPTPYHRLLVDDVLTTGASMKDAAKSLRSDGDTVQGLVIFARGRCPRWVQSLFTMKDA